MDQRLIIIGSLSSLWSVGAAKASFKWAIKSIVIDPKVGELFMSG